MYWIARRRAVSISTATDMPAVSGTSRPLTSIVVLSSDTVTGNTRSLICWVAFVAENVPFENMVASLPCWTAASRPVIASAPMLTTLPEIVPYRV